MDGFRVDSVKFKYCIDKSDLEAVVREPVFVEGLLGVGHVGLLAASHLVDKLDFEKAAELYSPHFHHPASGGDTPGVVYTKEGTAKLLQNELFYSREHDLFIYKGFYQADYCEFYYQHANQILDFCEEFGVRRIYTLGGLGTGQEKDDSETVAVVTNLDIAPEVETHAKILRGQEDQPGVTGLSGLLIGLAEENGIEAACLLGETHGAYPDPTAAQSVLKTLGRMIGFEIGYEELAEAAKEMEKKRKEFEKIREEILSRRGERGREDLDYIG